MDGVMKHPRWGMKSSYGGIASSSAAKGKSQCARKQRSGKGGGGNEASARQIYEFRGLRN
jgi:hypothetical protein